MTLGHLLAKKARPLKPGLCASAKWVYFFPYRRENGTTIVYSLDDRQRL